MDEITRAFIALDQAIERGPQDTDSLEAHKKNLMLREMYIDSLMRERRFDLRAA